MIFNILNNNIAHFSLLLIDNTGKRGHYFLRPLPPYSPPLPITDGVSEHRKFDAANAVFNNFHCHNHVLFPVVKLTLNPGKGDHARVEVLGERWNYAWSKVSVVQFLRKKFIHFPVVLLQQVNKQRGNNGVCPLLVKTVLRHFPLQLLIYGEVEYCQVPAYLVHTHFGLLDYVL